MRFFSVTNHDPLGITGFGEFGNPDEYDTIPQRRGKGAIMKSLLMAQNADSENAVRQAVAAFYAAFDDGFVGKCDFSTEDWNHINPSGGWTRGREDVLLEVRAVHKTFLKGVTDTIVEMSVRFAAFDVAVATVFSAMSPFVWPDGARHASERHIRTFVVVERGGRWLVMQDQNTVVDNRTSAF